MQEFKQKCLVLSASTYSIKDERTGETNSGLTLFYIPTDNLSSVVDEEAAARGQLSYGCQPSKATLPIEKQIKIVAAPALYELTLKMVTRQLKAQLQPIDISFVSHVELHLPKKS